MDYLVSVKPCYDMKLSFKYFSLVPGREKGKKKVRNWRNQPDFLLKKILMKTMKMLTQYQYSRI